MIVIELSDLSLPSISTISFYSLTKITCPYLNNVDTRINMKIEKKLNYKRRERVEWA